MTPNPPCFGDWHPGKRVCWRCDHEQKCYAEFDRVYGLGRLKPKKVRK